MVRNIEFANYNSTFSYSGRKVFKDLRKPSDLYEFESERERKAKKSSLYNTEAAIAAYNRNIKDKNEWLKI